MLSSKTVISRGTCVKKLNLWKSFSESFFDGACLCIVNLIITPVFLITKRYPFHVFFIILTGITRRSSRRFSKVERCKWCRCVEAKVNLYRFAKIIIASLPAKLLCYKIDKKPFLTPHLCCKPQQAARWLCHKVDKKHFLTSTAAMAFVTVIDWKLIVPVWCRILFPLKLKGQNMWFDMFAGAVWCQCCWVFLISWRENAKIVNQKKCDVSC